MTDRSRGLRDAFRALRHRDFALFWAGAFVSSVGMWMQNVTVPFLLHEATGSAGWVGLGAVAQFAPAMAMSPLGGSLADRHSRRTLLLWTQAASMVMAFALWLSVRGGGIRPGMIVALVGVTGVVTGLGIPAWQSFVAELVARESLLNAVTLNSAQFNASRAIGFMLGGLALYSVGPGLSFFANGFRSWRCWAPWPRSGPAARPRRPPPPPPAATGPPRLRRRRPSGSAWPTCGSIPGCSWPSSPAAS